MLSSKSTDIEGSFSSSGKLFTIRAVMLSGTSVESDTGVYRKFNVRQLLDKIMSLPLNDVNKARLEQLTLSAQEQAL